MAAGARALRGALGLLLVVGCQSGSGLHAVSSPSATPVPVSVRAALAARRYERLVLHDLPVALWPLDSRFPDVSPALPSSRYDGYRSGPPAVAAAGPVLAGQPHSALQVGGQTRLLTALAVGDASMPVWTVEFWFRAEGCVSGFRRIAGNSVVGPQGRDGIDVFYYPPDARSPCRVGAELWSDGQFRGGCAAPRPLVPGGWHHYAVTRSATTTSCFVDGALVNARSGVGPKVEPGARWGLGGSGTGYGDALQGSFAELAVYDRVVNRSTLLAHAAAAAPSGASLAP